MLEEVEKKLREAGYEVESYTDWIKIDLTDGVKVHLLADGTSQLELGFETHRDLNLDETRALADALRIFEEELQK